MDIETKIRNNEKYEDGIFLMFQRDGLKRKYIYYYTSNMEKYKILRVLVSTDNGLQFEIKRI